jgi:hypothetical protein
MPAPNFNGFQLYDDFHHAHRWLNDINGWDTHMAYLASKGFQGVVYPATLIYDNPANDTNGHGQKIISDVSGSNYTINPQHTAWVRQLMDRAHSHGLKVALVASGEKGPCNESNTGELNTASAQNAGTSIGNAFADHPALSFWIVGWDSKWNPNATNQLSTIWSNFATGLRSSGSVHPLTYHCAVGTLDGTSTASYEKFKNASWLDFHFIQSGHGGDAQSSSWWNSVLSSLSKPVWNGEARYAHVYEDEGNVTTANDMRLDCRMSIQYGGSRLIGITHGDWYRITLCDSREGAKYENAIANGGWNGVATTRLPGPNSYGGATNSIGNNGETAYIQEIQAVYGTTDPSVSLKYSLNSDLSASQTLHGATLPLNQPTHIWAQVTEGSPDSVTFKLDTVTTNVDTTSPFTMDPQTFVPSLPIWDTAWYLTAYASTGQVDTYAAHLQSIGMTGALVMLLPQQFPYLTKTNYYGHPHASGGGDSDIILDSDFITDFNNILDEFAEYNIKVGIVPAWGDTYVLGSSTGQNILRLTNAQAFGQHVAEEFAGHSAVEWWVLGGDMWNAVENPEIWAEMTRGLTAGGATQRIGYHNPGLPHYGISSRFETEWWNRLGLFQSGHCAPVDVQALSDFMAIQNGLAGQGEPPYRLNNPTWCNYGPITDQMVIDAMQASIDAGVDFHVYGDGVRACWGEGLWGTPNSGWTTVQGTFNSVGEEGVMALANHSAQHQAVAIAQPGGNQATANFETGTVITPPPPPPPSVENEGYFLFDGATQYLSTPDAADLSITGPIDIRFKVTPDDWTLTP